MYAALIKAKVDDYGRDISGNIVPMPAGSSHLVSLKDLEYYLDHSDSFDVVSVSLDSPALLSTSKTGDVSLSANGRKIPLSSRPVVIIGGDHPCDQWYGTEDSGMDKIYSDRGIKPYMAVNTGSPGVTPGDPGFLPWNVIGALRAEIISHGHRHLQDWSRGSTGITITYTGAGASATANIAGTPLTLTLVGNGGAENASFDLTNAAYDTLGELVAAISATPGWHAALAPELTGAETSGYLLPLIAARDVTTSTQAQKFAVCGGIVLSYLGAGRAAVKIASNTMQIFVNGIIRGSYALANASYDTFAELVAAINAAGICHAALCDDGASSQSYMTGDEASTSLGAIQYQDITQAGGVLTTTDGKMAYGRRFNAGLPMSYMVGRLIDASVETAATHGVTLSDFAQSGTGLAQWNLYDNVSMQSYRMDKHEWMMFPAPTLAALGDPAIHSHFGLTTAISKESVMAAIDALADSPGCVLDILCHALTPSGNNGYSFSASTSGNEYPEDDYIAILDHLKTKIDDGSIIQLTPSEFRRMRRSIPRPQNYVFNPFLRTSGASLLNNSSSNNIPGWFLASNVANLSALSITDGVLTGVTTSGAAITLLSQPLSLERGKTYRAGCRVEILNKVAGTGVRLKLDPRMNAMPNTAAASWSSTYAQGGNTDLDFMFTVPPIDPAPSIISGKNAGPFNITAGTNDTLTITADTLGVTVTLTAGAGRTASQIAADINAAFQADADFVGRQEYWNIASAVGNRVVLTDPYIASEFWNSLYITGNAAGTVFGSGECYSLANYAPVDGFTLPPQLRVLIEMQGTFKLSGFYCREANAQS